MPQVLARCLVPPSFQPLCCDELLRADRGSVTTVIGGHRICIDAEGKDIKSRTYCRILPLLNYSNRLSACFDGTVMRVSNLS